MKSNKKGFTVVELVIVVAIIAILAAVLIPVFANIVKTANASADIQAVRQMNTQLAVNEVLAGKSVVEVFEALKAAGMNAKNYTPITAGTFFFWDQTLNRVLYTDSSYNVIYPDEYKTATPANGWFSLNGTINKADVTVTSETVTVNTPEELYTVFSDPKLMGAKTITLQEGKTYDMMGVSLAQEITTKGIVINGNGATLTNLLTNNYQHIENDKEYYAGVFGNVKGKDVNTRETVYFTINNLTISGTTVGTSEIGSVGAVFGNVYCAKVVLNNVTVKDAVVIGLNKIGGFVGGVWTGTVDIKNNCKLENVTVISGQGESAKFVGCAYGSSYVNLPKDVVDNSSDVVLKHEPADNNGVFHSGTVKLVKKGTTNVDQVIANASGIFTNGSKTRIYANEALITYIEGTNNGNKANKLNGNSLENSINTSSSLTFQIGSDTYNINGNSAATLIVTSISE